MASAAAAAADATGDRAALGARRPLVLMSARGAVYIVADLTGTVAERVAAVQRRFDAKMAALLKPHITLAGSSGMGPLRADVDRPLLSRVLAAAAAATAPMTLRFGAPVRFMQTDIIVLPLDPHGPLRALHERLKTGGLPYARPRFAFTPHCTLSYYPTLAREAVTELLAMRFDEPVVLRAVQAYHTDAGGRGRKIAEAPLGGAAGG